jgi:hypothetical protein
VPDTEDPVSQEVELAGRVLQELGPPAQEFAARITGSATHELGEALADRIRLRRFRSQVKILTKAQEAADEAGLTPSVVPVKVLAPLLEFGGLEEEDNDDMTTRWANLLANAATDSGADVPPAFPDILRQLEPIEAKILDSLFHSHNPDAGRQPWPFHRERIALALGLPADAVSQSRIENLVRLGLAAHTLGSVERFSVQGGDQVVMDRSAVQITDLGLDFVRACQPPESKGGRR